MSKPETTAGIAVEYDSGFVEACLYYYISLEGCTNLISRLVRQFGISEKIVGLRISLAGRDQEATIYHPVKEGEVVLIEIHPGLFKQEITHEMWHLRDRFDSKFRWNPELLNDKSDSFRRTLNEIWDICVDVRMGMHPDKRFSLYAYEADTGDTSLFESLIRNPDISFPEMIDIADKLESTWNG